MNILIFEGIATSGKSTIIENLKQSAKGVVRVASEPETHIPIMHQASDSHEQFFINLITKLTEEKPDLLIFDRLYLTQAFRAHVSLRQYIQVEKLLGQYSARTIFLKVDEAAIEKRILKAAGHREPRWKRYIRTKGDSPVEIAHYYIEQQAGQLKLLEESSLTYSIFDTTNHNYEQATKDIIALL